jgi:hypothetical protein
LNILLSPVAAVVDQTAAVVVVVVIEQLAVH